MRDKGFDPLLSTTHSSYPAGSARGVHIRPARPGEGITMPNRLALFIDYQNCYKRARGAFFPQGCASHVDGQVLPLRLGAKLKLAAAGDRQLVAVRVYRGLPSPAHDPNSYSAAQRQIAAWDAQACVETVTRPLNYRNPLEPREKGIDVRLAIDIVAMRMRNLFDTAILMSDDTDLLPALELVADVYGTSAVEVATWVPFDGRSSKPLRVRDHGCLTHRLTEKDYHHVHDSTDYSVRTRRR